MYYRKTISNTHYGDQDCRWLNHQGMGFANSKYDLQEAAGEYLEKKNITVPSRMIYSGYRFADSSKFLTVWYMVNPEVDGFAADTSTRGRDSPWHRKNFKDDPKKIAYIDRLKAWTDDWYPRVKTGFDEKLTVK